MPAEITIFGAESTPDALLVKPDYKPDPEPTEIGVSPDVHQTTDNMFGSDKKDKAMSKTANGVGGGPSLNTFASGTRMEGKLTANTDIRIDGYLKGELVCDAKVIIGPQGSVEGIVRCQQAVIEGKFNGTLDVKELLHIRESASVNGEVSYGKLVVQAGAAISGTFNLQSAIANGKTGSTNQSKKVVEEAVK